MEAVGFGLLTLRRIDGGRTDGAACVGFENLPGGGVDPLGPDAQGWLDRIDWLRARARDDALRG